MLSETFNAFVLVNHVSRQLLQYSALQSVVPCRYVKDGLSESGMAMKKLRLGQSSRILRAICCRSRFPCVKALDRRQRHAWMDVAFTRPHYHIFQYGFASTAWSPLQESHTAGSVKASGETARSRQQYHFWRIAAASCGCSYFFVDLLISC